jgi:predicted small metal-binding protein
MKPHTLSCKELGNPACDHVAAGENDAEVKRKMLDHASEVHPEAVKTPADKDALGRRIDRVLEDKADGSALEETHGAHGRYGMEDESQGGEFLDDEASHAVGHVQDAGERRRDADRDAETRRTGEDLG